MAKDIPTHQYSGNFSEFTCSLGHTSKTSAALKVFSTHWYYELILNGPKGPKLI